MGTRWTVKLAGPLPRGETDRLRRRLEARLSELNQRFSTWDPDAELARFNRMHSTGWVDVSAELAALAEQALAVAAMTGGAFDPTVGALVNLWGFGPQGPKSGPPTDAAIEAAVRCVGFRRLEVQTAPPALRKAVPCLEVDLSALAKGHAVDALGAVLDAAGHTAWLVEIGGEVRVAGRRADGEAWRIAVQRPADGGVGAVRYRDLALTDRAVASSGTYQNFAEHEGERHAHLIDPRTGRPSASTVGAVSVVADTAAAADAYATALMVMDPRAALAFAERHALAVVMFDNVAGEWIPTPSGGFRKLASREVP